MDCNVVLSPLLVPRTHHIHSTTQIVVKAVPHWKGCKLEKLVVYRDMLKIFVNI